jgi:hypothetical protein
MQVPSVLSLPLLQLMPNNLRHAPGLDVPGLLWSSSQRLALAALGIGLRGCLSGWPAALCS